MLKDLKSKNLKKFFAKALIGAVIFGGVFLFSVKETQAATIYYIFNDGFPNADSAWNGSSDTTQSMPGWLVVQGISETDIMINNLDIASGSLPPSGGNHLTFYDADDGLAGPPETNDIACVPIDLSGFASVKIGYYWQTDDVDTGEGYRSAYSTDATNCTDGSWTLIDEQLNPTDDIWYRVTYSLSDADAVSNFWLRFSSKSNATSENTFIDDVNVSGTIATALGGGSNPGNVTIGPGAVATTSDAFTFKTGSSTDIITSVTTTLSAGSSAGISLVEITDSTSTTVYGSVVNPSSDSFSISLSGLIASTTLKTFKIRITPKSHSAMPAPQGSTYTVTSTITDWTGSTTNTHTGSDATSTTITIDNQSPANVTNAAGTPGDTQATLSWTKPGDADLNSVLVLRATSTMDGQAPTEGNTYVLGATTIGTSTVVACVVASSTGSSCTDSSLTNNETYYYKLFPYDNYANYATGSSTGAVVPQPGLLTQEDYQWFSNASTTSGYASTSDPTSGSDRAFSIAIDISSSTMYVAGFQANAGGGTCTVGSDCWRIEKRNLIDGSLVYATTSDPTTGSDAANSIAIDASSSAMYVAGYQYGGTCTTADCWRIEKRNLIDGSLVYATTSDPTSGNDAANSIAIDASSSAMYVVGYQGNGTTCVGSECWRIEKRNLSNLSLVYAVTNDPTIDSDIAKSIAIDASSSAMYVVGYQGNGTDCTNGSDCWRIEKRNLINGSLVYATTSDPTIGVDRANSIAIDASSSAMYVAGYQATGGDCTTGSDCWRIEKRNLDSNLSLVYAVTSDPTSGSDAINSIAIDASSSVMYVTGYASSTGTNNRMWRIEKRNLADGSLVYATTSDPSTGSDEQAMSIAIDASSSAMYVTGFQGAGTGCTNGGKCWRIEKRNLLDGSTSTPILVLGSALASQNNVYTLNSTSTPIRLRMNVADSGVSLSASTQAFKLQFSTTTSSGWLDVGLFASTTDIWRFYDETSASSSMTITSNRLSSSNVSETYEEKNPTALNPNAIGVGKKGEWDFSLIPQNASATTTYYFQMIKSSGTSLDNYTNYPTIAPITLTQEDYQWFYKASTTYGYATTSDPTINSDSAYSIAIDASSSAMYVVGSQGAGGGCVIGSDCWRIEKRNLIDGSLAYATTSDPTSNTNVANSIAIDTSSNAMYVAGYQAPGGDCVASSCWRIEKRNLSNLSLVYAITSDPTSGTDAANSIAIDTSSSAMYVAGYQATAGGGTCATGSDCWRIEKRNLIDGALVYATTSDPTSSSDVANSIVIDASSSAMYVAGYQYGGDCTASFCWRIEKRNLSDLSLVYATTSDPTTGSDAAYSIAIDTSSSAMYVTGHQATAGGGTCTIGNDCWRIEKRNLITGSLVYATTSDPTSGKDRANSIAIDASSSAMYVAGYQATAGGGTCTIGNNCWRIEKRNLSDLSLVYATTSDPTSGIDQARSIAIDTSSNAMYVAGYQATAGGGTCTIGSDCWRIEKRNLLDGSTSTPILVLGSALASQNNVPTLNSTSTPISLRMNVADSGLLLPASTQAFKLQFSTTISSGWLDVGLLASTTDTWRFYDETSVLSSMTITSNRLSSSNVSETYEEQNPTALNPNAIPVGQKGEWDFSLIPQNANNTYYFQMIKSSEASLYSYTNYPSITISVSVLTGTVTAQNHFLDQTSNQFDIDEATSTVSSTLLRFRLAPDLESMNMTTTTINIISQSGFVSADITYAKLFQDTDNDGVVDDGEPQLGANGTTTISGKSGTIIFGGSWSLTTTRDIILQVNVSNIDGGDYMIFGLPAANFNIKGESSLQTITASGSLTDSRHGKPYKKYGGGGPTESTAPSTTTQGGTATTTPGGGTEGEIPPATTSTPGGTPSGGEEGSALKYQSVLLANIRNQTKEILEEISQVLDKLMELIK